MKRLVAERDLEIDTMKEINRRKWRACELIEIPRSGLGYVSVRAQRDRPVLEATKRLAAQYPRYGYRRIRVFLRTEGHGMSRHRAHRLWRLEGLQLPRRRPRRRAATSGPRPLPAFGPNHVWAYDFVFDGRVIEVLTRLISTHGALRYLRSDNGPTVVVDQVVGVGFARTPLLVFIVVRLPMFPSKHTTRIDS